MGPTTGYHALLIGHSFFTPVAEGLTEHAVRAGFEDHTQVVFSGGGDSGAPQGFWEDETQRAAIQAELDTGDVDLFGMTYRSGHPGMEGYRNWIEYALAANPETVFFISTPWLPEPETRTAAEYAERWRQGHETAIYPIIENLRGEYPGIQVYDIPTGQAIVELYLLFESGELPDVNMLIGDGEALFSDKFGHADTIGLDLAELVWLRAIYGVALDTYDLDPGYTVDLKAMATAITDSQDQIYATP